jgi:hypothetical protein
MVGERETMMERLDQGVQLADCRRAWLARFDLGGL